MSEVKGLDDWRLEADYWETMGERRGWADGIGSEEELSIDRCHWWLMAGVCSGF